MGTCWAYRVALLTGGLALMVGCERPRTELMVRATTDMPQGPGQTLESVRLRVTSIGEGSPRFDRTLALGATGGVRLPADLLGVTPRDNDVSRVIAVDLSALGPGGVTLFTVHARSAFVDQQTRVLSLSLASRCRSATECPVGQTCGVDRCEPIDRVPASLGVYTGPPAVGPNVPPDAGIDAPGPPPDVRASDVSTDDAIDAVVEDARDAGEVFDAVVDAPDVTADAGDAGDAGDADDAADVPPLVCMAGRADCDHDPTNGCEIDLGAPTDCGACGVRCTSGMFCAGPSDGCVSVCPTTQTRCGFSCVDTTTTTRHCGACNAACAVTNGTPACVGGVCAVNACNAGYGDCDRDPANGCELSLTAITHCGACGARCAPDPANGSYGCPAGTCVLACNPGFVRSGSVCVADGVPRQVGPLSGAFLTSTRVMVRVAPFNTIVATQVEFCAQPSCATVLRSVELPPSATVSASMVTLPLGTLYWRARMLGSSQVSPVWRMNVRGLSAVTAPAVAWGSTLDMTLQGSGIVATFGSGTTATPGVTAASSTQVVYAVPGVPGGELPLAPLRDRFGLRVFRAGDTDGDGRGEFAVAAPGASSRGAVYVYRTVDGAGTRPLAPPEVLVAPTDAVSFGISGAEVGDLNGDGYGDLAVAGCDPGTGAPGVWTFHGGSSGLNPARSVTLAAPRSAFGRPVVVGVGDVNSDGYADLAVSDPSAYGGSGQIRVFAGGAMGVLNSPLLTLSLPLTADARFGETLTLAGDLNGDGRPDLAVGAPGLGNGRVYVFAGISAGFEASPSMIRDAPITGGAFGSELAAVGDVNADGYGDLAIAAPGANAGDGRVYVYHGASGGLGATPGTTLTPSATGVGYGAALVGVADRNAPTSSGAYFDDLAVSSASGSAVDVYEGAAGGLAATRLLTTVTLSRARPIARIEGPVAMGDLNRDAFADVVVALPAEGVVMGFWGTAAASARPAFTLSMTGATVTAIEVGDLNQDGFGDVAIGDVNASTGAGRVLLYPGSASGVATTPSVLAAPDAGAAGFGSALSMRADLSGDGVNDLVVGAPGAGAGDGRVYVYRGATGAWTGPPAGPNATISVGADGLARFGHALAVGEVTGDRYTDLIVGAPHTTDAMGRAPRVVVIPGSATGLDTAPGSVTVLTGAAMTGFGSALVAAGDVDGDHIGDLVVASRVGAGQPAQWFRGGAAGLAMASVALSPGHAAGGTGTTVAAADFNNDGFADVLLGNAGGTDNRLDVILGAMGGPVGGPLALPAPTGSAGYGNALAAGGDFNGDHAPDALVVSNTNGPARAWALLGRANPLTAATLVPLSDFGRGMLPSLCHRTTRRGALLACGTAGWRAW